MGEVVKAYPCSKCGKKFEGPPGTCNSVGTSDPWAYPAVSLEVVCRHCFRAWGDRGIRVRAILAKIRSLARSTALAKIEALLPRLYEDEAALCKVEAKIFEVAA